MAPPGWTNLEPTVTTQGPSTYDSRSKKTQQRQLLSCTKCRERKVKCDRTIPCSACCARGHPKECEFVMGEAGDYGPIQQSYEIRNLRDENKRLRQRLQAANIQLSDDGDDEGTSQDGRHSKRDSRVSANRQRRFKTSDRIDNLYFGTPGLANVVHDFANMQVGSRSLSHTVPRGKDMYAADPSSYPFPIVPAFLTSSDILQLLPPSKELFRYLDIFQQRAQSCSFPHAPDETTKKEVERFLADAEHNAQRHPDMLALIFATLANGLQMGRYDRTGVERINGPVAETKTRSDAFLGASMQCLRNASFTNQPTLLGIQTLIMMGPYLTNSGRFLDAWALFGTTIRLAQSLGLHRNPKFLDPVPLLRECAIRQTLWWWMLHMDQWYSVTLGRPLGISGIGDCPPPEQLTTNPTTVRLSQFVDRFTVLARQILGSGEMMSINTIDEYTDKLLGLWDTMPAALQFNESWLQAESNLPGWPLEVMSATVFTKMQSFLILLNRQRVERSQNQEVTSSENSPSNEMSTAFPFPADPSNSHFPSKALSALAQGHDPHPAPVRGRDVVINSSVHILQVFMFLYHRNPGVLICWTMGQQAFNASMILLLDAWEMKRDQNEWLVNQAYVVFDELQKNGVHRLAELAVSKIAEWLMKLAERRERQYGGRRHRPVLHAQQRPLKLDTAVRADCYSETVMGNTGLFLLEDPGLQSFVRPAFHPFSWNVLATAMTQNSPVQQQASYTVPVSNITPAVFPTLASPFLPNSPYTTHNMNSTRSVPVSRRPSTSQQVIDDGYYQDAIPTFTPINTQTEIHQRRSTYPQVPGPTGAHHFDQPPRSQHREKKRRKTKQSRDFV